MCRTDLLIFSRHLNSILKCVLVLSERDVNVVFKEQEVSHIVEHLEADYIPVVRSSMHLIVLIMDLSR